jgi:hypothetical protein
MATQEISTFIGHLRGVKRLRTQATAFVSIMAPDGEEMLRCVAFGDMIVAIEALMALQSDPAVSLQLRAGQKPGQSPVVIAAALTTPPTA